MSESNTSANTFSLYFKSISHFEIEILKKIENYDSIRNLIKIEKELNDLILNLKSIKNEANIEKQNFFNIYNTYLKDKNLTEYQFEDYASKLILNYEIAIENLFLNFIICRENIKKKRNLYLFSIKKLGLNLEIPDFGTSTTFL